jgi:16S rRNA (adenine1518-N6/adenine1519-N6)-dimethyltransferase
VPRRTRQRLGQHFLHDPAVISRILATIDPQPADRMVEIGPGTGALTTPLLSRVARLHVVELDRALAERLKSEHPSLQVHTGDALQFDFAALAAAPATLRVVGNLPYNISTPLLFRLLEQRQAIRDLHLMLQREVVERMAAAPGNKRYGRLTVMVALAARVERCFDIGPGAFKPPPRVWSSFVRVLPHKDDPFHVADRVLLSQLVAGAFTMRRKRISNGLRPWLSATEIAGLDIDPGLRPEQLTPGQFVALANRAAHKVDQGSDQ